MVKSVAVTSWGRAAICHRRSGCRDGLFRTNLRARHLTNVRAVLGTVEDPKLPKDSIDLVLLVDVYHEFSEPRENAGPDSGVAEARGQDRVPGISGGGSRGADSAGAQDDGRAGSCGS